MVQVENLHETNQYKEMLDQLFTAFNIVPASWSKGSQILLPRDELGIVNGATALTGTSDCGAGPGGAIRLLHGSNCNQGFCGAHGVANIISASRIASPEVQKLVDACKELNTLSRATASTRRSFALLGVPPGINFKKVRWLGNAQCTQYVGDHWEKLAYLHDVIPSKLKDTISMKRLLLKDVNNI